MRETIFDIPEFQEFKKEISDFFNENRKNNMELYELFDKLLKNDDLFKKYLQSRSVLMILAYCKSNHEMNINIPNINMENISDFIRYITESSIIEDDLSMKNIFLEKTVFEYLFRSGSISSIMKEFSSEERYSSVISEGTLNMNSCKSDDEKNRTILFLNGFLEKICNELRLKIALTDGPIKVKEIILDSQK
ncbi:MAG: hypothetical protein PHS92_00670 [Candidatus Gracilibacteria bacterium]|nr:hypothetical protein [Candidatus Gracilibacteria bacterium]